MYILPPSIPKRIEGYRWQSFAPPAAGQSGRFRGLICHRRIQRLRDELLNGEILYSLYEAQVLIEAWRRHYNTIRPHSSLGYRPPAPQTVLPHRGDPPFAADRLQATRRSPYAANSLNSL
ncbi:MAG: transposase [Verrucomicrobiota bacterium]|nr:transposase [Verrucomicrobiota bacterium]